MTPNFFQQFRGNIAQLPDQMAMQALTKEGKETFSYGRIGREIAAISQFLQSSGVSAGQSVGILMENQPRWGIAFLAAQSAGAVIVPFDILLPAETLAYLVRHSGCRFLISSHPFTPLLQKIEQALPQPLPSLVIGAGASGSDWEQVLEQFSQPVELPLVCRGLDEPLLTLYTSGTTGSPKGVILTQRNVFRNLIELLRIVRVSEQDHILCVLPLYHVLALMANFLAPLYVGARVSYLDALDAPTVLRTFREEAISIFVCVPQFYYLVQRRIRQELERLPLFKSLLFGRLLTLSRLANRFGWNLGRRLFGPIHRPFGPQMRLFGVGGARFDPEVARWFQALGFSIIQAYGLTETAALVTVTPLGQGVGSVGRPLPHVELKLDQPDEKGIGEVLVRGDNIMKGYWKNPEATREVLSNGWLHTGDLGFLSDGFLHITGRKKDLIVLSSGKNISPEELEHYYQSRCPFIKEMCILGVAGNSMREEKLHAIIVPDFDYAKSQQVANAADMIRYMFETLSRGLPPYRRVRSFDIWTEPLPRTTTRKIQRFEVQAQLERGTERPAASRFAEFYQAQTTEESQIFELVRQIKNTPLIHPQMNLELDLGFDSLERVEFLSSIQEVFQVGIPDEEAAGLFTVQDVVDTVRRKTTREDLQAGRARRTWGEILKEPLGGEEGRGTLAILARRPAMERLFAVVSKVGLILAKLLFRLKIRGTENLPRQGPFLICPNHLSFLDTFLVVSALPQHVTRRLFFLAYSDYFEGPILSFLGKLIKVIPVDSDRHLRQSLRRAAEGLRRQLVLCVFPEGERSIDGQLKRFRKGAAILAQEMQVPVVPVAIIGTYEAWSRGSSKIRLHPVRIRFGVPVRPSPEKNAYDDFNHRLMTAVQEVINQETGRQMQAPAH